MNILKKLKENWGALLVFGKMFNEQDSMQVILKPKVQAILNNICHGKLSKKPKF